MKAKRNPWPIAIILYFLVFITAMVSWITYAMRQDLDLVQHGYYEEEIRHQERIDQVHRTAQLAGGVKAELFVDPGHLKITIPQEALAATNSGSIQLYRPSKASLDQILNLDLNSRGEQWVDTTNLQPGFWKVKVTWNSGGKDYYFEKPLFLEK